MSNSLWPHGLLPARLLCQWDFPGKNTGIDCHFLLQGIFPTQGSNPRLLHYRQILYHWATRNAPSSYRLVCFFEEEEKKAVLFSYKALLYPRHLIIHKRQTVTYGIVLLPTKGLNLRLCWDSPTIAFIHPSKLLYIYHTSLH